MFNDPSQTPRARQSIRALRETLQEARTSDDAERIHVGLIEACDGLLAHAERQDELMEALRGDLAHKGIVSNNEDDAFPAVTPQGLREFASSSNGDRWFLGRDEATGIAHVVHRANQPSGGAITHIELGVFLNRGPSAPEMLGLLRLIGSLVT